jgi:CheY-like chemotaxis protein
MARILVIDDSKDVRVVLRRALEEEAHAVTEVSDGAEGLRAGQAGRYDLVFCDLFMPKKGGLDTIRQLRRAVPDVKVVAMSGGGPAGLVELLRIAKGLGAVAILKKPFGAQDVRYTVAEVLGAELPGALRNASALTAEHDGTPGR